MKPARSDALDRTTELAQAALVALSRYERVLRGAGQWGSPMRLTALLRLGERIDIRREHAAATQALLALEEALAAADLPPAGVALTPLPPGERAHRQAAEAKTRIKHLMNKLQQARQMRGQEETDAL